MEQDKKIHPMNTPEAEAARFQFLLVPHGDGLDINSPAYNDRVREYLNSLTREDISTIVTRDENTILIENLYVIPFIYARYKATPSTDDLFNVLKFIAHEYYEENSDNIYAEYFYRNFDNIMAQKVRDVPKR